MCGIMLRRFGNLLTKERYRCGFINTRQVGNSTKKKIEGVSFQFDEEEARHHFDRWLKSLWFAPRGWTESTRDKAIDIHPYYLPFWHCSLRGPIQISLSLAYQTTSSSNRKSPALTRNVWITAPPIHDEISLDDVNIYAAQTYDRYHLNHLAISFQSNTIKSIEVSSDSIDQWTVDKDTAFQIGWDLQMVPTLKKLAVHKAKQRYPQYHDYNIDSFHLNIRKKQLNLYYYPIYIINYEYGSDATFTCLVDGVNGSVTGDRQYSFTKVTFATLIGFYPAAWFTLLTVGSFIDPSIGIALSSFLTLTTSIPLALIISPIVGFLAQSYPKYYREKISLKEWKNYQSNSQHFTYDFGSSYQEQYQNYQKQQEQRFHYNQRQQQQQQRQTGYKEKTSTKMEIEDLYEILAVNRTATDREIKRAYLLKAKELHPDRNPGDKKAEELFKKVNQAYSILSDPYKRKQYDQYGYESVKYS